ncbi:MAG: hypothetical protein WCO35_00445 [Candidatus Nomurabacteria bacterium]
MTLGSTPRNGHLNVGAKLIDPNKLLDGDPSRGIKSAPKVFDAADFDDRFLVNPPVKEGVNVLKDFDLLSEEISQTFSSNGDVSSAVSRLDSMAASFGDIKDPAKKAFLEKEYSSIKREVNNYLNPKNTEKPANSGIHVEYPQEDNSVIIENNGIDTEKPVEEINSDNVEIYTNQENDVENNNEGIKAEESDEEIGEQRIKEFNERKKQTGFMGKIYNTAFKQQNAAALDALGKTMSDMEKFNKLNGNNAKDLENQNEETIVVNSVEVVTPTNVEGSAVVENNVIDSINGVEIVTPVEEIVTPTTGVINQENSVVILENTITGNENGASVLEQIPNLPIDPKAIIDKSPFGVRKYKNGDFVSEKPIQSKTQENEGMSDVDRNTGSYISEEDFVNDHVADYEKPKPRTRTRRDNGQVFENVNTGSRIVSDNENVRVETVNNRRRQESRITEETLEEVKDNLNLSEEEKDIILENLGIPEKDRDNYTDSIEEYLMKMTEGDREFALKQIPEDRKLDILDTLSEEDGISLDILKGDPKDVNIEDVIKKARLTSRRGETRPKKKEGFWGGVENFFDKIRSNSRESLLRREARLESPALKRKLEEMNNDVESKIGKLGNKSLNFLWDVTLGNTFRAIGDGIKSKKDWAGSIGEAVGSLIGRYLSNVGDIFEVVFGLVGVLGKKSWRGVRKLVAK